MKLVSVIVPSHNRVHLLLECLDSINQQTYSSIEMIVVDDASDEDVKNVVDGFKQQVKRNVKYIRTDANVGPGRARELGRLEATGDFICYQDSDDLWHPVKIASQVECLEQNPNAGMCYCASKEFKTWPLAGDEQIRKNSNRSVATFLPMLLELRGRPWGTGACMWTRWATEKIGPWSPGWSWEDMEYECRAGCNEIQIEHINKELCYYRSGSAEGQLRKQDEKLVTTQRADSIIIIGRHLKKHKLLSKPRIAIAYGWFVYDHAVALLKFREIHLSSKLLQQLNEHNVYPFNIRKTVQFTLFMINTIQNPFLIWIFGRIIKYCRVFVIKPTVWDNK